MSYFITSDNSKIYYKDIGEGYPIIFIHGFTASHEVFRLHQKVLSRKFRTISYDLRGHGNSSMIDEGTISLEALASDLRQLIEFLQLDNLMLVGWSLGGSVILEYISEFGSNSISKICLVDMSPKIINDENWNLGLYKGTYRLIDAINDLKLIKDNWYLFGEKFIRSMAPGLNQNQLDISIKKIKNNRKESMYKIWKSVIDKDYRDILTSINIPTLLLFGEDSSLYSNEVASYLNEKIEDSTLIYFDNCTHLLVLENPIKFNRVLGEFINSRNHSL